MPLPKVEDFLNFMADMAYDKKLLSVKIYDKRHKNDDVKMVLIKPVKIKQGYSLSYVYRHPTKDVTKNFLIEDGLYGVVDLLENDFKQAEVKTAEGDWHLIMQSDKKAKLKKTASKCECAPTLTHDKVKERLIKSKGNVYLETLGVTTRDGHVKNDMQDKYRQINKYIEIVDGVLKDIKFGDTLTVADMGAGKGYLTFALYDYLTNVLKQKSNIIGVELRKELVDTCNRLAKKTKYDGLEFIEGRIENVELPDLDVLIALHACDTATDDALYRGIQAGAKVIIAAPCCHKQIRAQLKPDNVMKDIVEHGILAERQAELLTDGMRSLMLESYGYKTRVFEFIATEHTPKNVLIVAVKKSGKRETSDKKKLAKLEDLKKMFGIKEHYLETLLLKGKK